MSPPSIHLIENLSTRDIEKLTQLLCLRPGSHPTSSWLQLQASRIPTLTPRLLKPTAALLRLGMSLNVGPDKATLCKHHKNLNPYLIRRIFLQVSAECTTRISRLAENPFLDPEIGDHVKRLYCVNSLWMAPELYRVTFHAMPQDPRFPRIHGDCEACILAAVGGDPQILFDLRTSMLGRKKKRGKEPRLKRLVEAWAEWTGSGPKITAESDFFSRQVRACRRQMQLARRQLRRNPAEGMVETRRWSESRAFTGEEESDAVFKSSENLQDEDEDDEDPEGSIINHYADSIRSSSPLLRRAPTQEDIHAAFRASMISLSRARTSTEGRLGTPRPPPSTSTSYATITSVGPDRLSAENLQRLHDLPPRPERPQNRSTYTDSVASLRMSQPSAVVPQLRTRQEPAYTESIYSKDIYSRRPADARSTMADHVRRADEEQARAYAELMRRREEESEAPPIPRRSSRRETTWSDFAARRPSRQDDW